MTIENVNNLCIYKKQYVSFLQKRLFSFQETNKPETMTLHDLKGKRLGLNKIAITSESILSRHLKSITKHLDTRDYHLIIPPTTHNNLQKIKDYYKKQLELQNLKIYTIHEVLMNKIYYKTVITDIATPFDIIKDPHIKFHLFKFFAYQVIRYQYSYGKNDWMFADYNVNFDYNLVYGPLAKEKTSIHQKNTKTIFEMGYPRYDEVYNISADTIKKRLNINTKKPIIFWSSTISEENKKNSITSFVKLISSLKNNYTIIISLHKGISYNEDLNLLKKYHLGYACISNINTAFLMKIADYVLVDFGGSMFGAMYLNKKTVILRTPTYEGNSLGEDSIDLKMQEILVTVDDKITSDQLNTLLQDTQLWKKQLKKTQSLKEKFFAPYYGYSGEVAAKIIMDIYQDRVKNIPNDIQKIVQKHEHPIS